MPYKLGKSSLKHLEGVDESLKNVVMRAISTTTVDFSVFEGLRTLERQRELVKRGASRTLNSRHLTGHAVDLVPWIGRQLRWDWPLYFSIARAMRDAARALDVIVRWGAVWDTALNNLDDDLEEEVLEYADWFRRTKERAFLDGPHFEIPSAEWMKTDGWKAYRLEE